ncbi:MAG TPA: hypothetical protein VEB20_08775 [Azospirillaceae bacterium]|nr:hypothetical protein [Azospirillaceae bacterium]
MKKAFLAVLASAMLVAVGFVAVDMPAGSSLNGRVPTCGACDPW